VSRPLPKWWSASGVACWPPKLWGGADCRDIDLSSLQRQRSRRKSLSEALLRILGIPIDDDDARRLVATLLADGSPDALTAAEQITRGVERDLYAVGLTRAERTAVLACLEGPSEALAELRGVLLREHRGSRCSAVAVLCWRADRRTRTRCAVWIGSGYCGKWTSTGR